MDTIVRQISLVFLLTLGLAVGEPPLSNQYGVPGNYAGPNNNQGPQGNGFGNHGYGDNGNDQDYVDNQPKSYEFDYAVRDQATGNDFGRRETSDGETVRGEYRVQLPDGRTQIVTYTADWRTGFHAEVRYEGTASYPDQFNNQGGGNFNNNPAYNNNNNNNNNNYNNNPGNYNNAGQGNFGYQGKNGGQSGYNGDNNGYNNYRQPSGGNYNGNNNNYNYQFGSNAVDTYNNFGARTSYNPGVPAPTYGPSFH